MNHILADLLSELTVLTLEEKTVIAESFPRKTFLKGSFLMKEEQVAKDAFYIVSGCVREYELVDGEEKTLGFFTEGMSVVHFESMASGAPIKQNYVCTEDTELYVLNGEREKALYQKHPRFETFCRTGMERMMGEKQSELVDFIALKPEQRYLKLQTERPDLMNRVPQYQIASYLGIKPETLSRIRKRLVKN